MLCVVLFIRAKIILLYLDKKYHVLKQYCVNEKCNLQVQLVPDKNLLKANIITTVIILKNCSKLTLRTVFMQLFNLFNSSDTIAMSFGFV